LRLEPGRGGQRATGFGQGRAAGYPFGIWHGERFVQGASGSQRRGDPSLGHDRREVTELGY